MSISLIQIKNALREKLSDNTVTDFDFDKAALADAIAAQLPDNSNALKVADGGGQCTYGYQSISLPDNDPSTFTVILTDETGCNLPPDEDEYIIALYPHEHWSDYEPLILISSDTKQS